MSAIEWRRGVPMRATDGATLVADVWHPSGPGPFPTLVVRTAYGREVASAITAPHPSVLARAGYLVVSQDVRGRGDSDGAFEPFVHEADDGAAAVQWASTLPESNGDVGMYGFSYQGACQLLAASRRPRALRAIAPAMCSSDPVEGFLWCGGALRLGFAVSWAAQLAGADGFTGERAADVLAARCATGRVDEWPFWDAWAAGRCGPSVDVTRLNVPALFTIGWFDTFASAGWRDVTAYGGPVSVLGAPWCHIPWTPDRDVATAAHLAFFDEHVARRPVGVPAPRVRSLACNATAWRSWAGPSEIAAREYGLASEQDASTRFGDGRLVEGHGGGVGAYAVHQPMVPVMAAGGGYTDGAGGVGRADQRLVQDRTDVLCFTSAPLREAAEIFGTSTLVTEVRSNAPTDDVCVTLCEVTPDGRVENLAFGAARGKGRFEVILSPVHAMLAAGSRLRVAIAPSAFPEIDVNVSAGVTTQVTRELIPAASTLRVSFVAPG